MISMIIKHQKVTGWAALWAKQPYCNGTRLSIKPAYAKQKRVIDIKGIPKDRPFSFFAGKSKNPDTIDIKPMHRITVDFVCGFF